LPASWEAMLARVTAKMRRNMRTRADALKRDGFQSALTVVDGSDDIQAAIDRFLALHAARSTAADMIHHPRRFAKSRERAFLVEYLHRMAERGQLRIFELEINGTVVATRLAFLIGTQLYLFYSGYDPEWRKYGIMTFLVAEIIKWAIDHRLTCVNLSFGNDQSKLRWKPTEIIYRDCMQMAPTARGKFVFKGFQAYEGLSRLRSVAPAESD
jgi:CelD/BcsL family acetyltransferase involved in cellulose biosynthesis